MLDRFTFGKAPAAIFLVERLNELGDLKLTRKVSAYIDQENRLLSDMVNANRHGCLSTHSLAAFLNFMRQRVKTSTLSLSDKLTADLTFNVVVGRIKFYIRKTTVVSQRSGKHTKETIINVPDHIHAEFLRDRSREKLMRRGKLCTYY